jgi:hypothetical protein
MEKLEPSSTADGIVEWYSFYEISLTAPQTTKNGVTYNSVISFLRYMPYRNKNICPHKN